jgi:DNA-binding beta-propeller fold protein YncE
MHRAIWAAAIVAAVVAVSHLPAPAQDAGTGPNKILKAAKVGGEGGFDYIFADVEARRLYTPRSGAMGHLAVWNLDTLQPVGEIAGVRAGGAVVDPKSHHGFSTTKPLTMWDSNTLQVIKTIDVDGRPDGIIFDPYTDRVWVLSHQQPYATIVDAKDGTVVKTLDVGGGPEQAVSDGKGMIYINISDKAHVAVIDAKTMTVKAHYDVSTLGQAGSGLALDDKNHVLFAYYRMPKPVVVILNTENGKVITTLPTGAGVDTVAFNPATMEAISAETGGTMTFIKENSPASFAVEQTLRTMPGAKTLALDTRTGHVLTMSAEYAPAPPGAPPGRAGRPARGPMVTGSFTILMVGR